jgi:hypothetical protein
MVSPTIDVMVDPTSHLDLPALLQLRILYLSNFPRSAVAEEEVPEIWHMASMPHIRSIPTVGRPPYGELRMLLLDGG